MSVPTSSQPSAHLGASASTASSPYLNQQVPDEKIALLAYAAGWRGHNVVIATAIALAESSGSNVVQQNEPSSQTGWGLWQITPGDSSLLDPSVNAKAAYAKYRGRGYQFTPWTTYNDGAYQQFMSRAQTAYNQAMKGLNVPGPGGIFGTGITPLKILEGFGVGALALIPGVAEGLGIGGGADAGATEGAAAGGGTAAGVAKGIASGAGSSLGKDLLKGAGIGALLADTSFWLLLAKIIGGLVMVGLGVYFLVKGS